MFKAQNQTTNKHHKWICYYRHHWIDKTNTQHPNSITAIVWSWFLFFVLPLNLYIFIAIVGDCCCCCCCSMCCHSLCSFQIFIHLILSIHIRYVAVKYLISTLLLVVSDSLPRAWSSVHFPFTQFLWIVSTKAAYNFISLPFYFDFIVVQYRPKQHKNVAGGSKPNAQHSN